MSPASPTWATAMGDNSRQLDSCDPLTPITSLAQAPSERSGNGQGKALKPGVTSASGGGSPGNERGFSKMEAASPEGDWLTGCNRIMIAEIE